ncbi:Metal-binding activator 1 [Candida viswanathii]|uniref:Metal-binding activator 1 n=1 Tax=Candida viswanathii TaxID=5486 RepID=A0A367YKV5_9ASCO|nr:Metal-binding activator 1 [Candida viswanathii]
MILIDDVKYACMECVRGHRSSSCKHHQRPLLQVRSKGRPVEYANGNPNHRVAVFAEEIADGDESNTTSKSKKCTTAPIVILKASNKQVVDLKSGEIIGPYDESKTSKVTSAKPIPQPQPVIDHDSFINTSSCCTPKISKGKSCDCCNNKKRAVNKSRILQNYIKNKLNNKIKQNQKIVLMNDVPKATQVNGDDAQVYGVVPVASCSIPGTCCCGDDCSCEGCIVHGNSKLGPVSVPNEVKSAVDFMDYNLNLFPPKVEDDNMVFNSLPLTNTSSYPSVLDPTIASIQNSSETNSPDSPSECTCPADSCDCTNCELHGIINGYKLDEYFRDQTKLLNSIDFNFADLLTPAQNPVPQLPSQPPIPPPQAIPQPFPQPNPPIQQPQISQYTPQPMNGTGNFEIFDYNLHNSLANNGELNGLQVFNNAAPSKGSCCSRKNNTT